MIPLSKKYFIDDLLDYSDDDFIIMSSHHPQTVYTTQYPMCYIVGNNKTFSDIFNLNLDWDLFINQIPKIGWYTDQSYIYEQIKKSNYSKCKFPYRNFESDNRIDRDKWLYDINKLKDGYYIDSHLLRPYEKYSEEINKLINHLN